MYTSPVNQSAGPFMVSMLLGVICMVRSFVEVGDAQAASSTWAGRSYVHPGTGPEVGGDRAAAGYCFSGKEQQRDPRRCRVLLSREAAGSVGAIADHCWSSDAGVAGGGRQRYKRTSCGDV